MEPVRALSPPRLDPGGSDPLNRSMFGLGLFKLLFLAGAVAGVWYLFKMLAGPSAPSTDPAAQARKRATSTAGNRAIEAEDMVACKICGTYVAANGARSCGRADCPSRG